jgi:hypothetical protein
MDWQQVAVTIGAVVVANVGNYIATAARLGERIGNVEKVQIEHKDRLDDHDGRFVGLAEQFTPRAEMATSLTAIRESQARTETWMQFLIFGNKPETPKL